MPVVGSNILGNNLSRRVDRNIPATSTASSTAIRIMMGNTNIGYIQSFTAQDTRSMAPVFQMGSGERFAWVPGKPETSTLLINRLMLYYSRLKEALTSERAKSSLGQDNSYPNITSIADINFPFDIHVDMYRPTIQGIEKDTVSKNSSLNEGNVYLPSEQKSLGNKQIEYLTLELYKHCWIAGENIAIKSGVGSELFILEDVTVNYTYKIGRPLHSK